MQAVHTPVEPGLRSRAQFAFRQLQTALAGAQLAARHERRAAARPPAWIAGTVPGRAARRAARGAERHPAVELVRRGRARPAFRQRAVARQGPRRREDPQQAHTADARGVRSARAHGAGDRLLRGRAHAGPVPVGRAGDRDRQPGRERGQDHRADRVLRSSPARLRLRRGAPAAARRPPAGGVLPSRRRPLSPGRSGDAPAGTRHA